MLRGKARRGNHVLDADIRDYFGSIDHDKLMKLLERRISDRRVLKLLRQWLAAGVMEDGTVHETDRGHAARWSDLAVAVEHLPARARPAVGETGARIWACWCGTRTTSSCCAGAVGRASRPRRRSDQSSRLGLQLHPEKTRRVELSRGRQGLRLSRVSPAQANERADLGGRGPHGSTSSPVAVARAMKRVGSA
jgi:RNA-directed DNA polymerase